MSKSSLCLLPFCLRAIHILLAEFRRHPISWSRLIAVASVLLVIGHLLLCYQMVILKAEHLHLPQAHPSSRRMKQHRLAIHLLSILLFAALVVAIVDTALMGGRRNVTGIFRAYVILLFIFWSLLIFSMLCTPLLARETRTSTGLFLLLLVSFTHNPRDLNPCLAFDMLDAIERRKRRAKLSSSVTFLVSSCANYL